MHFWTQIFYENRSKSKNTPSNKMTSGPNGESWSNNLELKEKNEKQLLKDESKWKDEAPIGCCRSKHTRNCCIATGIFGCIFLVLGVVVMLAGGPMLKKKIEASMALVDGSDRYESWLRPPVQPHLTAYAFHVVNPEAVKAGKLTLVFKLHNRWGSSINHVVKILGIFDPLHPSCGHFY